MTRPAAPPPQAAQTILPWRVGHKVGRTIYDSRYGDDGELIGVMDTAELAHLVVVVVNRAHYLTETRAAEAEAR